jgi:anti-sigma factor RsiW
MDSFLQERLEDYLAGRLNEQGLAKFERRLAADSAADEEITAFRATADLFAEFKVDTSEDMEPAPGFYYRVMEQVEAEQGESVWSLFLQPFVMRRFAFVALMWLLMLGSVAVLHDDTTAQSVQLADSILKQQPPEQIYVRLGPDLKHNRDSMLAVLIASAD